MYFVVLLGDQCSTLHRMHAHGHAHEVTISCTAISCSHFFGGVGAQTHPLSVSPVPLVCQNDVVGMKLVG